MELNSLIFPAKKDISPYIPARSEKIIWIPKCKKPGNESKILFSLKSNYLERNYIPCLFLESINPSNCIFPWKSCSFRQMS